MGQYCGDGNCKMVVTTEAFGLTRDVVYDGGQRRWAPAPLSVLPSAQYRLKVPQRTHWRLASAIQRELPQQRQSVKSVASRARRHCSGRPSAPGGGASVADRLPCRTTASNTSDQAILTSGVAHTVKATRPPGFSTRLHSAGAACCGRGRWFIPKLDTAAWNILSGYGRSSASPSITTISGCVFRATPTIAAEKSSPCAAAPRAAAAAARWPGPHATSRTCWPGENSATSSNGLMEGRCRMREAVSIDCSSTLPASMLEGTDCFGLSAHQEAPSLARSATVAFKHVYWLHPGKDTARVIESSSFVFSHPGLRENPAIV